MSLPIPSLSFAAPRAAQRLRRISNAASPYETAEAGTRIVTIVPAQRMEETQSRNSWTQRNFSAQLLELGLKHNVEGLVRKAGQGFAAATPQGAHMSYEQAQANFAEEGIGLFRFRT